MLLSLERYILKRATCILLLFCAFVAHAQEYDSGVSTSDRKNDRYFYDRADTVSVVAERHLPADVVRKMREEDDFWYANRDLQKKKKEAAKQGGQAVVEPNENGKKAKKPTNEPVIKERRAQEEDYSSRSQQSSWFQGLLWILIIGVFVTGLVMYLGSANVGLFRRKNNRTVEGEEMNDITEDIFAINYQSDIDKAAAQGNFRLAVRLLFLRLLKNMAEKNIIQYKQDKTNLDYLMELHPTRYYNSFFRVTREYEYSWYGQFPVSESAFQTIRNDFDQFDKELR